jgi:hypothetical protein
LAIVEGTAVGWARYADAPNIRIVIKAFCDFSEHAWRQPQDCAWLDRAGLPPSRVYNGTLGVGFGHHFDRISNAGRAFAEAAWTVPRLTIQGIDFVKRSRGCRPPPA